MQSKFRINTIIEGLKAIKSELPAVLANQAVNFFSANFKKQGFDDNGVTQWQEVQRRIPGTKTYKSSTPAARSRAILQGKGTGQLRSGVNNSLKLATFSRIELRVDVPYAIYLNEGTNKMPARPFMGESQTLDKLTKSKIEEHINKAFPTT